MTNIFKLRLFSWCHCGYLSCACKLLVGLPVTHRFLHYPPLISLRKGKGKDKVKVFFRYRSGVAQRVGRGIALLFHDRSTRRGWVISSTPRPHFTPWKDPVPILQETVWAPCLVWTAAEILVPTGIRSRTVQHIVSRHTDWATGPTMLLLLMIFYYDLRRDLVESSYGNS